MAKTRAKSIKKTVYLYKEASSEDWDNYRSYLEQKLKTSNRILNLLQKQQHKEQPEAHTVDQIWDIIVNSITEAANICLPKKRLQYSINNRKRQKKEKKSKTYKAIVQL
ncbi:31394_t:CDS:1, partial [Gigaspora margarita]